MILFLADTILALLLATLLSSLRKPALIPFPLI